jgi:hypothetical protein
VFLLRIFTTCCKRFNWSQQALWMEQRSMSSRQIRNVNKHVCVNQLRGNDVVTIVTFSPVQEQNTGFQEQQYHKVCAHAATSFIFPETLALADTNDAAFLLTFPTISLRYGLRGLGFFSVTLDRSLPASQTTKNSGGLL